MTIGFPETGRRCTYCHIEYSRHLYNRHLYCAPMVGCFNFCSEECLGKWYQITITNALDK